MFVMGARSRLLRLRCAGTSFFITRPVGSAISPELVEVPPGEQTRVMSVIEDDFDGILPDRLHRTDSHIFLPEHQDLLSRAMPLDFGGGRVHPEVLEWQLEPAAVGETHFQ